MTKLIDSGCTSLQSQYHWWSLCLALHPCQHEQSFGLFIFAILAGIIWNLWAILICIFMIVKDVEHLTVSQPFEISLKIPVCLDLYPKFNLNLTFFLKCTHSNNSCMYTSSWFINPHYMYISKYMYFHWATGTTGHPQIQLWGSVLEGIFSLLPLREDSMWKNTNKWDALVICWGLVFCCVLFC